LTNAAQLIVARSYCAGAELRLPPDDTALEGDRAKPAGKYDWGSSTVSSWEPVSCPEAAGTGDSEIAGSGEADETGDEGEEGEEDEADEERVPYGTPLVAHPARTRTKKTASKLLATDDTVLPNPIRTSTHDNVPFHVSGPHVAGGRRAWIMTLEHRRSPTAASG
jgi:hypothetical protein